MMLPVANSAVIHSLSPHSSGCVGVACAWADCRITLSSLPIVRRQPANK